MKRFIHIFLISLISATFMVACQPDDDDDITNDPREDYQGVWLCNEVGGQSYTVNISIDTTTQSQIKLFNFHHQGFEEKVNAVVAGTSLTINPQTMCLGTLTVEGTATMQSNKTSMNFYYTVNNGVDLDTIQAVYTKQSS
ncbi:MAG: hypothetical protein A2W93_06005 [Bacteroidetes bacterium GWF2_43_63]|nr:MAG: hypothetical protein A2W94_04500 [Bacteroidetes bacterium GWE2_42_42]OFY55972.1 MAG: hypothetical protein A2W93_06005 [Bacteroidetes bacterium GWF2_43_63]HBG71537.1 hypothetical protein [Bacteroidales bacterium]HCB63009.1 hypothetical protein [Bacteroidales bacterium]HCY22298.1 hypothetical protein [Bacteroidales bacterium]